jgi:hypothetical protein
LQELVLAFFVKSRPFLIDALLSSAVDLGAHTGIILYLNSGQVYEYVWSHPVRRPFGADLPISCTKCYRLKPWDIPKSFPAANTQLHVRCLGCNNAIDFHIPRLFEVTKARKDSVGQWFGRYWDGPDEMQALRWSAKDGLLRAQASGETAKN